MQNLTDLNKVTKDFIALVELSDVLCEIDYSALKLKRSNLKCFWIRRVQPNAVSSILDKVWAILLSIIQLTNAVTNGLLSIESGGYFGVTTVWVFIWMNNSFCIICLLPHFCKRSRRVRGRSPCTDRKFDKLMRLIKVAELWISLSSLDLGRHAASSLKC